jgi:hypothetical protein
MERRACQSEPVEDSRVKARPTMLRQATHDSPLLRHCEVRSNPQTIQGEPANQGLLRTSQ